MGFQRGNKMLTKKFILLQAILVVTVLTASQDANAFGQARSGGDTTPVAVATPAPPRVTPVVSTTPTPSPVSTPAPTAGTATETQLKAIYNQFISVFENSSLTLDYSYVSAEGDGRGYTAGRAGFTSRDGDMLQVVQNYLAVNPNSAFSTILSTLTSDANRNSGSTSGLSSLPSIWVAAANDPAFRNSQDVISDENYYTPAYNRAISLNIVSPIGILCFYDAAIEHGMDGDDGVNDMISRMPARSTFASETAWLNAFLVVRYNTLMNPKDQSTQAVWSQSVGRVTVLQTVLNSGNMNLVTPISINPFGDEFTVTSN
jgi:chitosanase